MQGARGGTRSRDPRIMPWAEGGAKPLSHPGCPLPVNFYLFIYFYFYFLSLSFFFLHVELSDFHSTPVVSAKMNRAPLL